MNLEIYLSVLGALCTFRIFDFIVFSMVHVHDETPVEKKVKIFYPKDKMPKELIKQLFGDLDGEDDDAE